MKKLILAIPEYFLIASVIFYWISTANVLNPFAISLLVLLILQIIFKNRILGILIPITLILACLFLLLALFSEFKEFYSFNSEAKTLLFVGLTYFLSTLFISGVMIYKYSIIESTVYN